MTPRELGRRDATRLRAEQGLPPEVEDVATLRALAAILDAADGPPVHRTARRRRRVAPAVSRQGAKAGAL